MSLILQALSQGKNQEAVAYMQRCKDMLLRLPKDVKKQTNKKNPPTFITVTTLYIIVFTSKIHIAVECVWDANCECFFHCRPHTSLLCATTSE